MKNMPYFPIWKRELVKAHGQADASRLADEIQQRYTELGAAIPVPGELEVLEDSADCFALKIYRCYLFDSLKAQCAPELTPLFCATDDWLAELLPRVRWERTQTLGRGGAYCDFCWHREKKS